MEKIEYETQYRNEWMTVSRGTLVDVFMTMTLFSLWDKRHD